MVRDLRTAFKAPGNLTALIMPFIAALLLVSMLPTPDPAGVEGGAGPPGAGGTTLARSEGSGTATAGTSEEEGLLPWGFLTRDGSLTVEDMLDFFGGQPITRETDVPQSGTPFFYEVGMLGPTLPSGEVISYDDHVGGQVAGEGDDAGSGPSSRSDFQEKYSGTHCTIYVDQDTASGLSQNTINWLGNQFENTIFPTDSALFDKNGNVQHADIGIYRFGDGAGGVGGYFSPQDPDAVYIDSSDMSWADEILAHEFQHLIHFDEDPWEEIWLNEGCSDFAIFACYGIGAGSLQSHIYYFTQYPDDDLTQWGQSIVDYGQAVAHVIYLWEQFGGDDFITDLVDSRSHGTSSISNVAKSHGYDMEFDQIFRNWASANHMDDPNIAEGQYGYASFNIDMDLAGQYSSYPTQGSGTVNGWASDYFRFYSGNDDLTISFDGTTSDTYMVNILQFADGLISSKVAEMEIDPSSQDGEEVILGFGSTYEDVVVSIMSSSGSASYSWEVILGDITPPVTTIDVDPGAPDGEDDWYVTKPEVTMEVDESGADIYYWFDDGEEKTYHGQFEVPEGEHTLYFHAEDDSDNLELTRSLDIKVDTLVPVTEVVTDPGEPEGLEGWFLEVPEIFLEPDEGKTDTWYRWEDSADWYGYGAVINGRVGEHTLTYYSVDRAGNTEDWRSVDMKVDVTTPVTTLAFDPALPDGNQSWYRSRVTATLQVEGEENEYTTYYALDSSEGEFVTYGDEPVEIPQGEHTLFYYSADIAGNVEPMAYHGLKVDTIAPVVNHTIESDEGPNEDDWYHTSVRVFLESPDNETTILYSLNDEDDYEYYSIGVRLPEGENQLYYFGVDEAGNAAEVVELEIWVDTEKPSTHMTVVPGEPGSSGWYTESPEIELESDEEEADIMYRWVEGEVEERGGGGDGVDLDDLSPYRRELTGREGQWTLQYFAVDPAGNAEKVASEIFYVDLKDPRAVLEISAVTIHAGDEIAITGINSSDAMGVHSYTFDFGDGSKEYTEGAKHAGDGRSDGSTTYAFESPGTYNITLVVEDVAGRTSDRVSMVVNVRSLPSSGGGDGGEGSGGGVFSGISGDSGPFLLILIVIAVAIIVMAAVIAGVVHSRRKREARRRAAARRRAMQARARVGMAGGPGGGAGQTPTMEPMGPVTGGAGAGARGGLDLPPPPPKRLPSPGDGSPDGPGGGDETKLLPPPPDAEDNGGPGAGEYAPSGPGGPVAEKEDGGGVEGTGETQRRGAAAGGEDDPTVKEDSTADPMDDPGVMAASGRPKLRAKGPTARGRAGGGGPKPPPPGKRKAMQPVQGPPAPAREPDGGHGGTNAPAGDGGAGRLDDPDELDELLDL